MTPRERAEMAVDEYLVVAEEVIEERPLLEATIQREIEAAVAAEAAERAACAGVAAEWGEVQHELASMLPRMRCLEPGKIAAAIRARGAA